MPDAMHQQGYAFQIKLRLFQQQEASTEGMRLKWAMIRNRRYMPPVKLALCQQRYLCNRSPNTYHG